MTISLFPTLKTEWIAPEIFPDLSSADAIAIDLETCDPGMKTHGPGWPTKNGYIVGFALAVDGWKGYFPIRHGGGGNLDEKRVRAFVQTVLDLPCDKIFFNAAYDVGWLKAEGFKINGKIIDAMIAAALIDENRFSYSLNALGFDYLQETKSEQGLRDAAKEFGVDPKGELYKLPAMYVGEYAEQDAALTLKLWQYFKIELVKQELTPIFELETMLCPHLIEMTYRGVRLDMAMAEQTHAAFKKREQDALAQIKSLSGINADIWAAASIAKVFDKLGIDYPKTEKGAPSFTKSFLNNHPHPIARAIVDAREYNKANGTFIESLVDYARKDGRVHGHINQLRSDEGGTVSGRLCVSGDTLLETSRGVFRIDEYSPQEGDTILTHRNRHRRILRKFFKGTEKMFKVVLENGSSVTCTAGHRMLTVNGWKSLRDISVGEEIFSHVSMFSPCGERRTSEKSGFGLHFRRKTNLAGIGKKAWDWVSHGYAYGTDNPFQRAGGPREKASLFKGQGWSVESYAPKNWNPTPQLQGGNIRWKGVFLDLKARLVHFQEGVKACFFASRGVLQGGGTDGYSAWIYRPPYRWGQNKQRYTQSGSCDDAGACPYSSSKVREIHPVGETFVWDIEVEEDHSYVAGGIVHHNSMAAPNLQQVPSRHPDIGPAIRKLFLPEEGEIWASLDFSQQEPRLAVHYAKLLNLRGADKAVDAYVNDPTTDFHQMIADMAGIGRKQAKTVGLGFLYGLGKAKMAVELDLTETEASELLGKFHELVPFMKGLVTAVQQRIDHPASNGAVRTLLGRRCRFNLWEPTKFGLHKALPREQAVLEYGPMLKRAYTYKGLNRLIQGSAADQTKKSMLACVEAGKLPLLQVHDELCLSVESVDQANKFAQIMMDCVKLEVPSKVDVECGPSWGEAA